MYQNIQASYKAENNTIKVANLNDWRNVDTLWYLSDKIQINEICTLDMSNITYLNPQAIIMLFMLCKKMNMMTDSKVRLSNLSPQIAGYLHRINFFNYELTTSSGKYIEYGKSPLSRNLIELTKVDSLMQINKLGSWFYCNFEHWFPDNAQSMYRQLSFEAINELCSNSVEHSSFDNTGEGFFLLQKYIDSSGKTNVIMSVGDYGIGIRSHLLRKYPIISSYIEPDIILEAISGRSGRLKDGGGRGLKSICNLTKDYGGYFVIRSGYGLVFIQDGKFSRELYSYSIPGTQCAFCLRVNN